MTGKGDWRLEMGDGKHKGKLLLELLLTVDDQRKFLTYLVNCAQLCNGSLCVCVELHTMKMPCHGWGFAKARISGGHRKMLFNLERREGV